MNDELSMDLTRKKLDSAKSAGVDALCVTCPYCQYQFKTIQKMIVAQSGAAGTLPSILFPQLLGLSLGIDERNLGLQPGREDWWR
jgi:heterodisulfide reductase subunit B